MFTPVETTVGALLLHQATSVLLYQNGTLLGASGYMRQLFTGPTKGTLAFFVGMAMSLILLKIFLPQLVTQYPPVPSSWQSASMTIVVGAIVGCGTKISGGCTSGHMLCGLSRLNAWSAAAVASFFPTALITHHLVHPSLYTEHCPPGTLCYLPTYPSRTTTTTLLALAAVTMFAARTIPRWIAIVLKEEEKRDSGSPAAQATQLFAGLEFGLGLHITQMASPSKVLSFLSFPKLDAWDPSMALVILFGIIPSFIEIQTRGFTKQPLFNTRFVLPKKTFKDVNWRFISGAAMFGVGWGLTGTCPGPAMLRSFAQPMWGILWMGGFWLGGSIVAGDDSESAQGTCQ